MDLGLFIFLISILPYLAAGLVTARKWFLVALMRREDHHMSRYRSLPMSEYRRGMRMESAAEAIGIGLTWPVWAVVMSALHLVTSGQYTPSEQTELAAARSHEIDRMEKALGRENW